MTSRRHTPTAWPLIAAVLLSSCAGHSVATTAGRRAEALGLDAAERDAFTREVQACMGAAPVGSHAVAPSTTVAVGAAAEAPTGSAGGLAAVASVATSAVTGIPSGASHLWTRREAADDPQPPRDPTARAAVRGDAPVGHERIGSAPDVVASARSEGGPATPTLDSCLHVVTARWRGRGAPVAPTF